MPLVAGDDGGQETVSINKASQVRHMMAVIDQHFKDVTIAYESPSARSPLPQPSFFRIDVALTV